MKNTVILLLGVGLIYGAVGGIPKVDRVYDQKLSDQEQGTPDYDTEAFLGRDEAKTVASLTHEEKLDKLAKIAKKIDEDGDGLITEVELQDWITMTQQRYIQQDVDRQFPDHDINEDGVLDWDEYENRTYGHLDDHDWAAGEEQGFSYADMLKRDKDRWEAAVDKDTGKCDKLCFKRFLHPEEFRDMHDVVLKETIDDMDKDKDGFIDQDEYIQDMHKEEDGSEPEWVQTEREQFHKYRDLDHDGKLNLEEIRNWVLPADYNHANAEAMHLIYEADDDKDGVLSVEEILEHEDLFMGSQATDWGEQLLRHEEL